LFQSLGFPEKEGLPHRAMLLLDNAPSHPRDSIPTFDSGLIDVKFLLPTVTAITQPMDKGVSVSLK
jgi:hypothetical protein